ncbi:MAG: hypothetical protein KME56_05385 [Candidatus Thiodiazotropha sp. (ex Ctena orbiculata)]|uniref:Uncharacterized protein n=1 Tax=Candidatus Thiodiazotropha taylori TaxID=2792791 RepID=A0A944QVD3_9GAMM|nr:hypothetical protein [Candidatus Thiodiazotropha taylori]MBT2989884.1 hypothetical protein [Candidatus Thiodiazotropha taylori]MBT2996045.1 hypothetical protein [Candidatus Thiodiazotropha taylori]MBT3001587.1 hypothetical protein [Candidatus Thiodiazotropha taylori]MBT3025871.1 hypothetical protein [Candidatus Thiodiazotropha taylori]
MLNTLKLLDIDRFQPDPGQADHRRHGRTTQGGVTIAASQSLIHYEFPQLGAEKQ